MEEVLEEAAAPAGSSTAGEANGWERESTENGNTLNPVTEEKANFG